MRNIMRKLCVVLMALTMIVSLAACASGGGEVTEPSGTGGTTAPTEAVMQNSGGGSKATEPNETAAPTVENAGGTSEPDSPGESNSTEATTGKSAEPTAGSTNSGNTGNTSSGNTSNTSSGNTGSTSSGSTGNANSGNTSSTSPSTPAATTPKPTEPVPTSPPAHTHGYTETVVAPTCTAQGYTLHTCACGDSYKDTYVDKVPHWMVETERVAATLESEGYVLYTCAYGCGRTETETLPKLTEYIDTVALEQYGINYGVNTYGCIYSPGLRDGYYPGYQVKITTMAEGYKYVVEEIDCLIANLLGVGAITQQDINNKTVEARIDLGVENLGDGYFLIRAYYG